jgi:hypothetical protein
MGDVTMHITELRPIPLQFNNSCKYFCSPDGNVWRELKGRPRRKETESYQSSIRCIDNKWFKLLKPEIKGKLNNYLSVYIDKYYLLHRLVLLTYNYVENYQELQCNHKNRNTFDNSIENLEWVTNKENSIHKTKTFLPKPYDELREEWKNNFEKLNNISDVYEPKPTGGILIYDLESIKYFLGNTDLSMEKIAEKTNSSFRAVRYWQEKLKIKRPKITLIDKIIPLLESNPNITPNEISEILGVRNTSVHAVLRKIRSNTH